MSRTPPSPASRSHRPARAGRRSRGFTLVELMVVIVILGGLIALVGPRVFTALGRGNVAQAETQMHNFAQAIDMYYLTHRKLPNSLEALMEEDPRSGDKWMNTIPKDPWEQPYDYRVVSSKKYTIRSYGEDMQEGTADDITWPKEGQSED